MPLTLTTTPIPILTVAQRAGATRVHHGLRGQPCLWSNPLRRICAAAVSVASPQFPLAPVERQLSILPRRRQAVTVSTITVTPMSLAASLRGSCQAFLPQHCTFLRRRTRRKEELSTCHLHTDHGVIVHSRGSSVPPTRCLPASPHCLPPLSTLPLTAVQCTSPSASARPLATPSPATTCERRGDSDTCTLHRR